MNDIETLPRLIDQAMAALDNATTAAEVLDARDQAKVAYDAAKSAARFAKAKSAHATILATCHRMQADALTIEARAQSRLADEYDAAQSRGEINKAGKPAIIPGGNNKASVAEAGLKPKEIHEARQIRDAEKREPDIVRKAVDAKLAAGEEPTRADVKRAVNLSRKDAPEADASMAYFAELGKKAVPEIKAERKMTIPDLAAQIEAAPTGGDDEIERIKKIDNARVALSMVEGRMNAEWLGRDYDGNAVQINWREGKTPEEIAKLEALRHGNDWFDAIDDALRDISYHVQNIVADIDEEESDADTNENGQDEIAPPEVIAENILYCIARVNENARVFNKLFKLSTFDRETAARINTAIDGLIKKWRSIQSTLERGDS
jgi:hypothetical protein